MIEPVRKKVGMNMAITIREVAKRAGVSVSTASLALNGKPRVSPATRQKVLQAAQELDYYPHVTAKNLADGQTRTLSLIIPVSLEHLFSSAGFFARLLQGMHRAALEGGYRLSLHIVESEEEAADQMREIVRSRAADGLLITNPTVNPPYLDFLKEQEIPYVFIGRPLEADLPHVDNDNIAVSYLGVSHLIEKGHRRIAFLNGPDRFTFCLDRLKGYRQALAEAQIPYDEELVWTSPLTEEQAYETTAAALRRRCDFSALFAVSDIQAIGALRALREGERRVPEDVALVCVNNTALTHHFVPPLTTIDLHEDQLGYWSVRLLIRALSGKATDQGRIIVPSELILRGSCGCHWRSPRTPSQKREEVRDGIEEGRGRIATH